jgi:hypothetical protein
MVWTPVLDGRLADDARRAVRDIAAHIDAIEVERPRPGHVALFWAYAAGYFDGDDDIAHRHAAATERFVAELDMPDPNLHLFGGLAGTGWVIAHAHDGADELLAAIDRVLCEALAAEQWVGKLDLTDGVAGLGIYFLERGDAPLARTGCAHVRRHLEAQVETTAQGATWRIPPAHLAPWQRERWPAGYYGCGVAHGVPGLAAVLARLGAHDLAARAIDWVRAQRRATPGANWFPGGVAPDRPGPDAAMTAWCHGDLGIALALWGAAEQIGAPADEWRALAADCARRSPERCTLPDPALCHGAAGMAHACNRGFQRSGDPVFRDAARAWIARTLAMRRPGEGIAGFARYTDQHRWVAAHDLLDGAAGIGLALLAALADEEPGWDRLLAY